MSTPRRSRVLQVLVLVSGVVIATGASLVLLARGNPCAADLVQEWNFRFREPLNVPDETAEAVQAELYMRTEASTAMQRARCRLGSVRSIEPTPEWVTEIDTWWAGSSEALPRWAVGRGLDIGRDWTHAFREASGAPYWRVHSVTWKGAAETDPPTRSQSLGPYPAYPVWIDDDSLVLVLYEFLGRGEDEARGQRLMRYQVGDSGLQDWARLPTEDCFRGRIDPCYLPLGWSSVLDGLLVLTPFSEPETIVMVHPYPGSLHAYQRNYSPAMKDYPGYWQGRVGLVRSDGEWLGGQVGIDELGWFAFESAGRLGFLTQRGRESVGEVVLYEFQETNGTLSATRVASAPLPGAGLPFTVLRPRPSGDSVVAWYAGPNVSELSLPELAPVEVGSDIRPSLPPGGDYGIGLAVGTSGLVRADGRRCKLEYAPPREEFRGLLDLCGQRKEAASGYAWTGLAASPSGERVAAVWPDALVIIDFAEPIDSAAALVATWDALDLLELQR